MASKKEDNIDFTKLEEELHAAMESDAKYWRENDAKFRAIDQKVATYEEFRDMVLAAHLRPLDKKDKMPEHFTQPWNPQASKNVGTHGPSETQQADEKKLLDKLPQNSLEFAKTWRRCPNQEDKYNFLLRIGGEHLTKIFKAEISFGLLGDILEALLQFKHEDYQDVLLILEGLTKANRFGLSVQFLNSKEKEFCQTLFKKLKETESSVEIKDNFVADVQLRDLTTKYSVHLEE